MVLIMTAGTAFVMWLAELITQRGIGQGMSLLIFANVVAGLPVGRAGRLRARAALQVLRDPGDLHCPAGRSSSSWTTASGASRSPSRARVVGRKEMGGNSTYIPLKVNQSGVIPIIFASSVLYIPVL